MKSKSFIRRGRKKGSVTKREILLQIAKDYYNDDQAEIDDVLIDDLDQMFSMFVDKILDHVKQGKSVYIHGFGTFKPEPVKRWVPSAGYVEGTYLRFRPSSGVRIIDRKIHGFEPINRKKCRPGSGKKDNKDKNGKTKKRRKKS